MQQRNPLLRDLWENFVCKWCLHSNTVELTEFVSMSHFYTPWKRQETYGMMKLDWVKVDIILLAIQKITCHNTVWQFEKLRGAMKSMKKSLLVSIPKQNILPKFFKQLIAIIKLKKRLRLSTFFPPPNHNLK